MSRYVKRMMIDSIRAELSDVQDLLFVDVSRVRAVSVNRIRMNLADHQIHLKCVNNSVVSQALIELGVNCASCMLTGPSAIVFGNHDISTLSKQLSKYSELHKDFEIKSGIASGRFLRRSDIEVLIKSPGRAELLSQISSQIIGPSGRLASTLSNSYSTIAGQIHQLRLR